nr:ubiquitin-conjugating enzyme E2Q-like protein 1 [Leptinotarsa decemlineata]
MSNLQERLFCISKREGTSPGNNSGVRASEDEYRKKTVRERRVTKELRDLQSRQNSDSDPSFTVDLVNGNLFQWEVKLFKVDRDSDFGKDMEHFGVSHVLLQLSFPENFPFSPPLMTIQSPTIKNSFFMDCGIVRLEILNPQWWTPAYTVEAIIMQFAACLAKSNARIQQVRKEERAENSFWIFFEYYFKHGLEID